MGSRTEPTVNRPANSNRLAAAVCFICGALPIGIALGVIPAIPGSIHAPAYIVVLAGLLFWFAGVSLLFGSTRPKLNSLLGAILFALFAILGGWVSVFGTSSAFGGGIPFVSHAANEWMARLMFGGGAVLCALCSLYALNQVGKPEPAQKGKS